jgi:hypothetical protein
MVKTLETESSTAPAAAFLEIVFLQFRNGPYYHRDKRDCKDFLVKHFCLTVVMSAANQPGAPRRVRINQNRRVGSQCCDITHADIEFGEAGRRRRLLSLSRSSTIAKMGAENIPEPREDDYGYRTEQSSRSRGR